PLGGPMVAPSAGILTHASPELAEGHEQHALEIALRLEVLDKRLDRSAQVLQQPRLWPGLIGMRVISALRYIKDARGQTAADQARHQLQPVAQWGGRVNSLILHPLGNGANLV